MGYIGTGRFVALLYIQLATDWLVTARVGAVFVLFGVALLLNLSDFPASGHLADYRHVSPRGMHNS